MEKIVAEIINWETKYLTKLISLYASLVKHYLSKFKEKFKATKNIYNSNGKKSAIYVGFQDDIITALMNFHRRKYEELCGASLGNGD